MGWEVDPRYWGRGWATEAAGAAVDFAFQTCHVRAVRADCHAGNGASLRVMEKIGMAPARQSPLQRLAIRAYYLLFTGERRPIVRHRLTRSEWEALQTAR